MSLRSRTLGEGCVLDSGHEFRMMQEMQEHTQRLFVHLFCQPPSPLHNLSQETEKHSNAALPAKATGTVETRLRDWALGIQFRLWRLDLD